MVLQVAHILGKRGLPAVSKMIIVIAHGQASSQQSSTGSEMHTVDTERCAIICFQFAIS